ncbi:NADH:flavin oxidoreductase/NADH oxidase [Undibacterium luofuense]|uniref:NADH:flavin oxidoreductase/NADH oxidase n=1 Tax=Undibacterium luofuense TaxID=2828733 RepID=A0A941I6M1_9BURK|nr:NADH:flavin oxidoreductase/NADH oxidase [Undibacterium luofuense]MBR7781974.1 NADH:flavin oxidoreductase/NADH oxidase [Undibacterium luofuense]
MQSQLFSPFQIGQLTLPNRIVIAPMCQYSAQDGMPSDWHLMHLGAMSHSGAGLLILEATAVEARGRISPLDLGIWSDAHRDALKDLVQRLRQYSSMPLAIQLAHAGRKASSAAPWNGGQLLSAEQGGWQTVAPSAIPHYAHDAAPDALTLDDIQEVRQAFTQGARRALEAGFDSIELHAAHGYLLHQFMSPLSNQRTDQYGGSLENRLRLTLEIFDDMKQVLPANYPLGIRISASDWAEGGWDLDSSLALTRELEKRGCAFIHVSSGGLAAHQNIPLEPGYQVPFAKAIKAITTMPVIAVGLITEAKQAEQILQEQEADLIGVARVMLYNPHWPWHAAAELGAGIHAPRQYWRSQPREVKNLFIGM